MKKHWAHIFRTLLIINLALTGLMLCGVILPEKPEGNPEQRHTLYIGLNDKDSAVQIISTQEAMEIVNEICVRHVDGYTVVNGQGFWTDHNDALVREETLIYTFVGAGEEQITRIMDEVLQALNQEAILCERQDVVSTFYSGL